MNKLSGYTLRAFAVMLLMAVMLAAMPCEAETEGAVLRVAFPHVEGFSAVGTDGQPFGLIVDFLNEIAKYTGWKYDYVETDGESIIDQFLAGEFDLMGGTYYAEGYEVYFAYPDYNCGYSKGVLLARQDDDSIKSHEINSLNGKTIGVYDRAVENVRRMKEYLAINGLDCPIRYYTIDDLSGEGNLYRFLENGDVDLLLGSGVDAGVQLNVAATFDSQAHYIVTTPGNTEILDGLNAALERIYEAEPNFARRIYDKNFPDVSTGHIRMNEREREYVSQKGSVSVAVPLEWHPLFCRNSKDSHEGIVPDMLKEVSDYSGLAFTYVYCDSYAEALHTVEQGEADILGFFIGTDENALEKGLARTASYVDMDSILVRNKESSYPASGLTGGVLEGRVMPGSIAAETVRYYADDVAALSDVNRGKADFYYGISSCLEHTIQAQNFTNLVHVSLVNDSLGISFAMPSPVQPELFSILNKAVNNLSEEQKTTISNRNIVSIGNPQMSLTSIVYANPALVISVVTAFLVLILLAILLISRSRLRSAQMRVELEKAEADSHAKSDFLSRMSHEIRTPMNAIVGLTDLTEAIEGLPPKARENLQKIKSSSQYMLNLISDILDMSRIENGRMEMNDEPFSMSATLDNIQSMMTAEAERKRLHFILKTEIRDDALVGDALRLRQVILNLLSNAFKFTPNGGEVTLRVQEESSTVQTATYSFLVADNGVGIAPEDQKRIFQSFEQVGANITKSQGTGLGLAISRSIVSAMGGDLTISSEPGKGSVFTFTLTMSKGKSEDTEGNYGGNGLNQLSGAHILMAEDNDLNAAITTELLEIRGAQITRAENGRIALELYKQHEPGTFQAILMDVLMPEMNGLEATRAIRALSRADAQSIPIIAMTANAFKEDEEQAMEAGMNAFVPKPIDLARLDRTLASLIGAGHSD